MSEHKYHEIEYGECPDTGTYQTGSIKTPKSSGMLLAVLMAVVIFLGGLCSALGILNIRLLDRLLRQPASTMPLSKDTTPATSGTRFQFHTHEEPAPSVPEDRQVALQLQDAPYYFSLPDSVTLLSADEIYAKNTASLVEIHCMTHFHATRSGIGVVLTSDGYLLTNAHIVDAASWVMVKLPDGDSVRAAVVGSDPFTDLAVLYVPRTDLIPAEFCYTDKLQVTEPTFALERMSDDNASHSIRESGVFSTNRRLTSNQMTLPLVQTFSGADQGPVFNSLGQIIGMQAGKVSRYFHSDDTRGLGLVIPSDVIREVVLQLTQDGYIPGRPDLGMEVEPISKLYQNYWDLPGGMLITKIDPNSAAAQLGLQKGDILLALDGQSMTDREDLYILLYSKQIGQEVTAVILRDQRKFTVRLVIGEGTAAVD